MYVVYIDHIHHLLNEHKKSIFAYNSDRREYIMSERYLETDQYCRRGTETDVTSIM